MNRALGHLCAHMLNWARKTSWGWWDDWDDTVLQTQDSKFEPWRSEAEHATSRSQRLPTILTFTHGWGRNIFCFFQTAETGNRAPNSGVKGYGANHYPRAPARHVWYNLYFPYLHCPDFNVSSNHLCERPGRKVTLMLSHRHIRWTDIKLTLCQRIVFAVWLTFLQTRDAHLYYRWFKVRPSSLIMYHHQTIIPHSHPRLSREQIDTWGPGVPVSSHKVQVQLVMIRSEKAANQCFLWDRKWLVYLHQK